MSNSGSTVEIEDFDSDDDHFDSHPRREQLHPPLSPANPAESFFLSAELKTSPISAFALAAQIHSNSRSGWKLSSNRSNASAQSAVTDDFVSTCEHLSDFDADEVNYIHNYNDSLFGKDVLIHSREPIPEDQELDFQESNENMADPSNTTAPGTVNAAEKVYETAKGIWIWGKGIPIIGFAEGIAEAVVNKVVGVAGTSLEDIDAKVKPRIYGLDKDVLNPAIDKVVSVILAAIGKGDETLRPIFLTIAPPILRPFGLLKTEDEKKKTAEEPLSSVVAPEITTVAGN